MSSPLSSQRKSNISAIKQTKESIPQDVQELYNKPSSSTRQKLWKKKPDPSENRIVNYFRKKNNERSSTFDTNRQPAINTNLNSPNPIKSINENEEFKKSQTASAEAKATALEINASLQQKNISQDDLLQLNTKMILQMQNAHELLSTALIKRDSELTNQFTLKLNEATEFVSKELNVIRKEIEEIKSSDDVEKLATITACKDDLKKLWIRFTFIDDVIQYREKNNPPMVSKEILNQLNINLNKIMWPIESANFQIKKFSRDQLPETALAITFINSTIANKVKYSIINFNNQLEELGKTNLIRYRVATDWSYQVRKILKYCNEMKRCGALNKVMVTNEGIKVFHEEIQMTNVPKKPSTENSVMDIQLNVISRKTSLINSIKQLDSLRVELKDFNYYVSVIEAYNDDYYAKRQDERLKIRKEFNNEIVTNEEEEMERTVSDCSFSSVQGKDQ